MELEKRLFRYAKVGPELLEMADEGLVLAAKARLGQSLSAAQHTEGHLQVVGVGEWRPTSTRPSWNAELRLPGSEGGFVAGSRNLAINGATPARSQDPAEPP